MFGRDGAARSHDRVMNEGVDRLTLRRDPGRTIAGSLWRAHVEMHIAIAQMPEGRGCGAGEGGLGRRGRFNHEGRHLRDGHADVILQRRPLRALGFRKRFADPPEGFGLGFVGGDGCIDDDSLLHGLRQGAFQPFARARIGKIGMIDFDQNVPGRACLDRRSGTGDMPQHKSQAVVGNDLEPFDAVAQCRFGQAKQAQRLFGAVDARPAHRARGDGGHEAQRRGGDDAKGPLRTDQQLLDVIAAIVLLERVQPVEDTAVGQHRLQPIDQRAHRAMTQHLRPASIGGHKPPDRCGAFCAQA